MKVRTRAFVELVGLLAACIGSMLLLDYIFPKYGFTIYMSGVLLYILWCLYNIRVLSLSREQDRLIDKLKE